MGVVGVVMLLAILFQPVYVYQLCYALGGCQNTLDGYLDDLLKEDRGNRKIKRDVKDSDLDYAMRILKMAIHVYGQSASQVRTIKTPQMGRKFFVLSRMKCRLTRPAPSTMWNVGHQWISSSPLCWWCPPCTRNFWEMSKKKTSRNRHP